MKNIIKLTLLFFAILMVPKTTLATHVIGGNFEVCQTGPNTFDITLRVYRDCNPGNSSLSDPSGVEIYDNVTNSSILTLSFSGAQVGTETIINLGDACYSPTGICVEEYIYTQSVNLPDNSNGYYIAWDICCRNSLISNASDDGSTYYVQIPDPAIANMNCSPDFGGYPTDGYFCLSSDVSEPYIIDPMVTDADGDSLVFHLVNPYDDGTTTKPFNLLAWLPGYSNANILGNATLPPMSINSQTGIITCYPENIGVFVFAILVEEYRGGVKIGEVVRDVQYSALNCSVDAPPIINLQDTVEVTVGEQICTDMYVQDLDGTDTIYLQPTSNNFDLTSFVAPNSNGVDSYYLDFYGNDTMWIQHFEYDGTTFEGIGEIPVRYCWVPECGDINEDYKVNLLAYSLGCSGSDTAQKEITIRINPQSNEREPTPNIFSPNGDGSNDEFKIRGISDPCFDSLSVVIFNRWGRRVYESNDPQFRWDGTNQGGTDCASGVYFVLINGNYGSRYNPATGGQDPIDVTEQFTVQLVR